jgi:environmental stress-induced protein Ves
MSLHPFNRDTLPVTPWKNGGGSTCEIACWPPGAGLGDFGWRASIARIAVPGPFSVFEGVDRHIMLLDGDGVRLRSVEAGIDHALHTPHQPFAFSGDAAIDCTLLGGASSDFNVMVRRGLWRAEVHVLEQAASLASIPHGVLMALRGRWQLNSAGDDGSFKASSLCHTGEGLCWTEDAHAWQVTPLVSGAKLLAVQFTKG